MSKRYESCPPNADAMISSLRAFGYDLSMALADLIDNSITAGAKTIKVDYSWNSGNPWIRIIDDGCGMKESVLKNAMRLGSRSPLEPRNAQDLGRFGLGLKTASFSQCKLLTVYTRIAGSDPATRCWDLDHVEKVRKWELGTAAPNGSRDLLSLLNLQEHGTVVLLQKLDRVMGGEIRDEEDQEAVFLRLFRHVARYMEMVFHRFLEGRGRIKIEVGVHECKPWDPFLTSNQFTQVFGMEHVGKHRIEVQPYVLPHVSKRSDKESIEGAGLNGWNAHQGFYIYRNKRMIIAGGYLDLDFKCEEHFKLCRIRVDLPNDLDHAWNIDVRKAAARPPGYARGDLERIARAARALAVKIYRARTGPARETGAKKDMHEVWLRKVRGEKVVYELNRNHGVICELLDQAGVSKIWTRNFFHLIQKSVPHRMIIMDSTDKEDCLVDLPEECTPPPKDLIAICEKIFRKQVEIGKDPYEAAEFVCAMFDQHASYRAAIDKIIEEIS